MITVSQFRNARSVPHISFETVNGKRLDIELENFQYALVRNNEKGTLQYRQYKGNNYFESFIRDTEA